ncbi:nicotinate (nicotinamide) nucleotide adenylyltransferase [bacterium]|nr:nicotinate (nicotinamide) nucleotide adenylyltransferase [bacterium]
MLTHRGIFGGTFDPPHLGHLSLAQNIAEYIPLDIVNWVPARIPPHKDVYDILPSKHRVEMVKLAIQDKSLFEICLYELESTQQPWTVFLLERFRREFPNDVLHLLIGGDSLVELHTWKEYDRLWQLAEIDVAVRPGWDIGEVNEGILRHVKLIPCPIVDIEATEIRRMVSRGESIDGLVTDLVKDYIYNNELYKN